ncbi:MAG TPA: hypothetical protein VEK08_11400 [Planctomycetota bacterium]|nr:hypothetical protein [Planctomycetota bacterium]
MLTTVRSFFALFMLLCSAALAGQPEAPAEPAKPAVLPRLLAKLQVEPLVAVCSEDARTLPEKFSKTYFNKMLQDPAYAKGADHFRALINHYAGADVPALWPDFTKLCTGPMALAILPRAPGAAADAPDFQLVMAVVTPTAKTARQLLNEWPRTAPQSNTLFSALRLIPVPEEELPAAEGLPDWATSDFWPNGDLLLRAQPKKLGQTLKSWFEKSDSPALDFLAITLANIRDHELNRLGWQATFSGELISEEVRMEAAAENTSAYARVLNTIRENPAAWDSLLAATPGDGDAVLLAQTDPAGLAEDLPYAGQAMERYLRGKKWSRSKGRLEDALTPERFDFLLKWFEGSFAITAKPTPAGDVKLTLVTAFRSDKLPPHAGGEAEALRAELVKGFAKVGAEFDTLAAARKIGTTAPLGALFQGRGIFGAPVIGLSPGWAWLCSSSAAYQDLTQAFKSGKTLATDAAAQAARWRGGEAVRLQVDLEKVLKLAYAAWLLSGEEGPFVGAWKVPSELLPQPVVFNNRLSTLRTGLSRSGNVINAYSTCALPLASFILPSILQEAAETIEVARMETRKIIAQNAEQPQAVNDERKAPNARAPDESKK